MTLAQCGLRHAARDFFDERADLYNGEPLPKRFGFFDGEGRLRDVVRRSSFVEVRSWVDDDDSVLAWVFPEGLSDEDRADLVEQLAILRSQPWSPQAGIDALLKDWPEDEEERDISFAEAERRFVKACEEALASAGASDGGA